MKLCCMHLQEAGTFLKKQEDNSRYLEMKQEEMSSVRRAVTTSCLSRAFHMRLPWLDLPCSYPGLSSVIVIASTVMPEERELKLREGNFLLKDTSMLHVFKYSCPNDVQIYTCCLDWFWKHTFAYPAVHLYLDTNRHLRFNTSTDESGWLTLWQLHLSGSSLSQLILAYRSALLFCCCFVT